MNLKRNLRNNDVITLVILMAKEPNEWTKTMRRSSNNQSGGILLYINAETLHFANIPNNKQLEVKQYPCKNGRVVLKFREID